MSGSRPRAKAGGGAGGGTSFWRCCLHKVQGILRALFLTSKNKRGSPGPLGPSPRSTTGFSNLTNVPTWQNGK